ncbi:MAG: energy transducer TonB [Phycisphaerales bacterium]|nr:energy transducer TonB [Phycisphaerales bacterium]
MSPGPRKSLIVSLTLHAVVFAAAAGTLGQILPRSATPPLDEHSTIMLCEEDATPPDASTVLAGAPGLNAFPDTPRLPPANAAWPTREVPHLAPPPPMQSIEMIAFNPTRIHSPNVRPHRVTNHSTSATGIANGAEVIATRIDVAGGEGTGEGASPAEGSAGGNTGGGGNDHVASLSATGTGTGNAWGNSPPVPLAGNAVPTYPPIEQRNGTGGTVLLLLTITEDGTVAKATVITSSGSSRLAAAALTAAKKWRFQSVGHGPTVITVQQEIRFAP